MEHTLTCNNLKCRRELTDRALVTTCSHIFCLDCASQLGTAHGERCSACPACSSQLPNPDDAAITNLNPSEDYKTSVLSGLSPNIIMECAGRALSFWAYQTTQELYYQQYLYKTLTEKYSNLSIRLDKTVNDANAEIDGLQNRLAALANEQEALRRRNEEISHAYREKNRKLLQTQELYDKVKRKAEMGHIQRAASDAVTSTLQATPQASQALGTGLTGRNFSGDSSLPAPGQNQRFDFASMNTGLPRTNMSSLRDESRWARHGRVPRSDMPSAALAGHEQRASGMPFLASSMLPGPTAIPVSVPNGPKRGPSANLPGFANSRGSLAGVGLTSGLKVSQPMNQPGLETSIRSH